MTEIKLRRFSGPSGEYEIAFNPEKLPERGQVKLTEKRERKFSIRIMKEDLILLDELAKRDRTPRSVLINKLIQEILLDDLMNIELDARVLIAKEADQDADYDPLAQSWLQDVLADELNFMVRNVMAHGRVYDQQDDDHSALFVNLSLQLKERLK